VDDGTADDEVGGRHGRTGKAAAVTVGEDDER
jgi:hypothetical protein